MKTSAVWCIASALLALWNPVAAQSPSEVDSLTRILQKERSETAEWLRSSPSSYLATIGRVDFGERSMLTVGRNQDNDVVLEEPFVSPHHLSVTVLGDSFQVKTVDASAFFTVSGVSHTSAIVGPSAIGIGRLRLRHEDRLVSLAALGD